MENFQFLDGINIGIYFVTNAKILNEKFNIEHTTMQFECTECEDWKIKH